MNESSGLGTTSLDSLPTGSGNVTMQMTEKNSNKIVGDPTKALREQRDSEISNVGNQREPAQMDVNEFVSGLQSASANGLTKLRTRDLPIDETRIQHDVQTKPNFVPSEHSSDYITEHQTSDAIVKEQANKQKRQDSFDDIYSELSLPILIALLYFLYQLPAVRKMFIDSFPFCYAKSGNLNLTGYLVNSVLFGVAVYAARKCVEQLST
jgi:hypothetical protein